MQLGKYDTAERIRQIGISPNTFVEINVGWARVTPLCAAVRVACKDPCDDMKEILKMLLEDGGRLDTCILIDNMCYGPPEFMSCLHIACKNTDILSWVLKHNTYPITCERQTDFVDDQYNTTDWTSTNDLHINLPCRMVRDGALVTPYEWALETNHESAKILGEIVGVATELSSTE